MVYFFQGVESCSTKKERRKTRSSTVGKTVERTGVIINARHVLLFETRLDIPTNTHPTPIAVGRDKLQTFLANVFTPQLFTISFDIDPLST